MMETKYHPANKDSKQWRWWSLRMTSNPQDSRSLAGLMCIEWTNTGIYFPFPPSNKVWNKNIFVYSYWKKSTFIVIVNSLVINDENPKIVVSLEKFLKSSQYFSDTLKWLFSMQVFQFHWIFFRIKISYCAWHHEQYSTKSCTFT